MRGLYFGDIRITWYTTSLCVHLRGGRELCTCLPSCRGCTFWWRGCHICTRHILSGDDIYRGRQYIITPPDTRTRTCSLQARYPRELCRWCSVSSHGDSSRPEQYIPRRRWGYPRDASTRDCNRWYRVRTLMPDTSCIWRSTFLSPITWPRCSHCWVTPHRCRTPQTYEYHQWLWSVWRTRGWDTQSHIRKIKSLFLRKGIFYIFWRHQSDLNRRL